MLQQNSLYMAVFGRQLLRFELFCFQSWTGIRCGPVPVIGRWAVFYILTLPLPRVALVLFWLAPAGTRNAAIRNLRSLHNLLQFTETLHTTELVRIRLALFLSWHGCPLQASFN